jgi:hypothetical protein
MMITTTTMMTMMTTTKIKITKIMMMIIIIKIIYCYDPTFGTSWLTERLWFIFIYTLYILYV